MAMKNKNLTTKVTLDNTEINLKFIREFMTLGSMTA